MDTSSFPPIATLLVIAGLVFLFVALVRVGGKFILHVANPKTVLIIGTLLVVAGLISAITGIPDRSSELEGTPTPTATPTPSTTSTPTEIPTLTSGVKIPEVKITYPSNTAAVNIQETVTGTARNVPEGQKLWILVYPPAANKFYPQSQNVNIVSEEWSTPIGIGTKDNVGEIFDIVAVLADQKAQEELTNYINTGVKNNSWSGMDSIPDGALVYDKITVTRV
jgi:hypothetical protein